MRSAVALLLGTALVSGCGQGSAGPDTVDAAARCDAVTEVPAPGALSRRVDLGTLVTWEQVDADTASVNAVGVADAESVAPVLATLRDDLATQDWEVFSLDDEGFEAEVLARDRAGVLLGITLREGACPTHVEVMLSITDYSALD